MSSPPRVLLVEDNAIYREALELLLGDRDDVEIAGSVVDGETALEHCADWRAASCASSSVARWRLRARSVVSCAAWLIAVASASVRWPSSA